jgi:hypothetical protein
MTQSRAFRGCIERRGSRLLPIRGTKLGLELESETLLLVGDPTVSVVGTRLRQNWGACHSAKCQTRLYSTRPCDGQAMSCVSVLPWSQARHGVVAELPAMGPPTLPKLPSIFNVKKNEALNSVPAAAPTWFFIPSRAFPRTGRYWQLTGLAAIRAATRKLSNAGHRVKGSMFGTWCVSEVSAVSGKVPVGEPSSYMPTRGGVNAGTGLSFAAEATCLGFPGIS